MIVNDKVEEVFQEHVGFIPGHTIDAFREAAVHEDGFPACDGVGADDGVDGGQATAGVEWMATGCRA